MKSPAVTRIFFSLFFALTVFSLTAQTTSTERSISIRVNGDDYSETIILDNGLHSFNIEYNGFITLANDDRDIVALSGGGYFKVKKSAFGSKRRIEITADRSGNLTRKYFVGWSEKPYEPEGREWLEEILPTIVRSSTIGAEDRVNRIYSQGGMAAFSEEVQLLDGDYVKKAYLELILCKDLTDGEVDQVVTMIGNEIDSDHYLSEILGDHHELFLSSPKRIDGFIRAARSINSDHYLTEVLEEVVTSRKADDKQMGALLQAANGINSDHYRASLLIEVMESRKLDDQNLDLLLGLARGINSDHYMAEVLEEALEIRDLPASAVSRLLENVNLIQSDHYVTEVLENLLETPLSATEQGELLVMITNEVSSDHYRTEILEEFVDEQTLYAESFTVLQRSIADINSDNYKAQILREIADLSALSDEQIIGLIQTSATINSDHYLAEALLAYSGHANSRGEKVKTAYRNACREISSETYYGRALKALND